MKRILVGYSSKLSIICCGIRVFLQYDVDTSKSLAASILNLSIASRASGILMRLDFLDILFLLLLFHRETTQNLSMLLPYGIFAFSPLWGGLLFSPPHPYLLQSRCKYALENTPILGYEISHDKTFICRRIILRLR